MKELEKGGENIKVFVRIKPLLEQTEGQRSKSTKQASQVQEALSASKRQCCQTSKSKLLGKSPLISRSVDKMKAGGLDEESLLDGELDARVPQSERKMLCSHNKVSNSKTNPFSYSFSQSELPKEQSGMSSPRGIDYSQSKSLLLAENFANQFFYKQDTTRIANSRTRESIEFSSVFDHRDDNESIYRTSLEPNIPCLLQGVNVAVFMYGQTNSGKTFTMRGAFDDSAPPRSQTVQGSKVRPVRQRQNTPGFVQLAIRSVFGLLGQDPSLFWKAKMSYVEVYNEKIFDLLAEGKNLLELRERDGVVQVNSREVPVNCEESALATWIEGERKRHFAATSLNHSSSRSHVLLKLSLDVRNKAQPLSQRLAHLTLADLAGSENANKNFSDPSRFREGTNINRSLLALTSLISKMRVNPDSASFRDSKLTRLLQNALGGNCRTSVICTLNPEPQFYAEGVSTLRFAVSVGAIKTLPRPTEIPIQPLGPSQNELELQTKVESLSSEVATSQSLNSNLVKELELLKENLTAQTEELNLVRQLLAQMETSSHELATSNAELSKSLEAFKKSNFTSAKKRQSELFIDRTEKKQTAEKGSAFDSIYAELKGRVTTLEIENQELRTKILRTETMKFFGQTFQKPKPPASIQREKKYLKRVNNSLSKEELAKFNEALSVRVSKFEKKIEQSETRETRLKTLLDQNEDEIRAIKKEMQQKFFKQISHEEQPSIPQPQINPE